MHLNVTDSSLHTGASNNFDVVATVSTSVVGRYMFYNQSSYDGNDPAANAADSTAIATNKSALLPGQTATFSNVSSYALGINGITVDVANLPAGTLTAADFNFAVGGATSLDVDPSLWSANPVPVPVSITAFPGAGTGGSTRIEIIFATAAIRNKWIQVTVKATANTGLTSPDVFYFGNLVAESGNGPTPVLAVTNSDILNVRAAAGINPVSAVLPIPTISIVTVSFS